MLSFISYFIVRHHIYVEYFHKVHLTESSLSAPGWLKHFADRESFCKLWLWCLQFLGLQSLCFSSTLSPPTGCAFGAHLFCHYLPPRWMWMALTTESSSVITQIPKPNRLSFVHYKAHIIKRTCAIHLWDDSCISLFAL